MNIKEKIAALRKLSALLKEQADVVGAMSRNEDSPVYDVEWGRELKISYMEIGNSISELKNALGL